MFSRLKEESLEIQRELIAESNKCQVDTVGFFQDIEKEQLALTSSQRNIHRDVRNVEEKWSNTDTVKDRSESFVQATAFFQSTENTIRQMTKKMRSLVDKVAQPPTKQVLGPKLKE